MARMVSSLGHVDCPIHGARCSEASVHRDKRQVKWAQERVWRREVENE